MEGPKFESLKFLGIGMGGVLVALQALMSYKRAKAMEDTANAQANAVLKTEQGQRQERMKNAIEHLGHESDSVRLGGASELFHLAKDAWYEEDNGEMRQTVLDILCAHIRQTTGSAGYRQRHVLKPSEEVQSLLTLLFVRDHRVFDGHYINLQGCWLNGAELATAHLYGVDFSHTYLRGASFHGANLHYAYLFGAHLEGAYLVRAQMDGVVLYRARLQGANLGRAQMRGADLFEAQLHGVNLASVPMQGSILGGAQLQGAYLAGTELHGVQCGEDISGSFAGRIGQSIGLQSDLSWIFFSGGLKQDDLNCMSSRLKEESAKAFQEKLTPHISKPVSHELPEDSGAIIGSYTEAEAGEWIAEYNEAVGVVPEDDS